MRSKVRCVMQHVDTALSNMIQQGSQAYLARLRSQPFQLRHCGHNFGDGQIDIGLGVRPSAALEIAPIERKTVPAIFGWSRLPGRVLSVLLWRGTRNRSGGGGLGGLRLILTASRLHP